MKKADLKSLFFTMIISFYSFLTDILLRKNYLTSDKMIKKNKNKWKSTCINKVFDKDQSYESALYLFLIKSQKFLHKNFHVMIFNFIDWKLEMSKGEYQPQTSHHSMDIIRGGKQSDLLLNCYRVH